MSNLFDFLTDLAANPQKQLVFSKQPDTLMEVAGLSDADKVLLKSREKDQISTALGNELAVLAFSCVDPGEDPLPDPDPPSEPDSSEKN